MKYLFKKTNKVIIKEDLDLVLQDEIFGKNPDGHEYEEINEYVDNSNVDINIDVAIKVLEDLKKSGSTHVSIFYHVDHFAYHFTGSLIREATELEISDGVKRKIEEKKFKVATELAKAKKLVKEYEQKLKDLDA